LPPAHRLVVAVARWLIQHGEQTIVEPHSCFYSYRRTSERLYAPRDAPLSRR
jgi:hypothetical protein